MLLRSCICSSKQLIGHFTHSRCYSINIAVVGSGPAGFYTTQKLLRHPEIKVDIYEKLPVPFGLIRYGVAPDHPEVKNVINTFTSIANRDRVDFYGNVNLGQTIKLEDLQEAYHAVVLAYGSAQDKLLGIEGEQTTKNTISARSFVGWYNGVPEDKDLDIDLDCDTACIIGQGNVALDCARILLKPSNLEKTDITSFAQRRIADSKIKRIYIIGRRGPMQVSFTTKELREIYKLNEHKIRYEPSNIFSDMSLERVKTVYRQRRRITELMMGIHHHDISKPNSIELVFKFLSKPNRIIADPSTGGVKQLELMKTEYPNMELFLDEKAQPEDAGKLETIDCGLVIRSIGYKAVMVDKSLPMNHKLGALMNTQGRVHGHRNLYCSGWLATGASGVVAGTLVSSQTTAQSILSDIEQKALPNLTRKKLGHEYIDLMLARSKVQMVHFNDWLRIDELERRLGEAMGKTREKFVDVEQMLQVARGEVNKSTTD